MSLFKTEPRITDAEPEIQKILDEIYAEEDLLRIVKIAIIGALLLGGVLSTACNIYDLSKSIPHECTALYKI